MKFSLRLGQLLVTLFAIILLAACASSTRTMADIDANTPRWQGRLWLKVLTVPAQAFSADFDLQGTAQTGELTFTSPLGSTLARLEWGSNGAVLQTTGAPERFASLDALTQRATGTSLPIASLFSWLRGQETTTPGWDADLHALPSGRLEAKRLGPDAPAELKIILEH